MYGKPRFFAGLVSAGACLALAAPVSAHHALEALYDTSTEIQTTAVLAKVDWINPHAWMRFDITYADGRIDKNVLVETVGIAGLRQLGIDRDALKIGAQYRILFHPSRDGSVVGFMTRLVLPSGSLLGEPSYDPADDAL
jgi:hypothetical protein